jgi:hypothetical protein
MLNTKWLDNCCPAYKELFLDGEFNVWNAKKYILELSFHPKQYVKNIYVFEDVGIASLKKAFQDCINYTPSACV